MILAWSKLVWFNWKETSLETAERKKNQWGNWKDQKGSWFYTTEIILIWIKKKTL